MVTAKVTSMSFDRDVLKTNWSKINESPAKKAGLRIRTAAVRSVRKDNRLRIRKNGKVGSYGKPSPPGHAPFSRGVGDPLRLIFSLPDEAAGRVIVGPLGFGNSVSVPEVHEKGLTSPVNHVKFYTQKELGHGNRIEMIKHSRVEIVQAHYPKRAFMVPAMTAMAASLPPLWRGSLGG